MTGRYRTPASVPDATLAARPHQPDTSGSPPPIVALTYPYAGAEELRSLLTRCRGVACTSGTGLLPLAQQAMQTWRLTEQSQPPSRLALTSVRALTSAMITATLARTGQRNWCEIATAPPAYAETFLSLYPGTRFLSLHRDCAQVIHAAMRANPWGLSGPEFGPFTNAHPGDSITALATYWAARTGPMLAFEAAHPDCCLRVRHEDITRAPGQHGKEILTFLDLCPAEAAEIAMEQISSRPVTQAGLDPAATAAIPASKIPEPIITEVNTMLARLGYPPLGHSARSILPVPGEGGGEPV